MGIADARDSQAGPAPKSEQVKAKPYDKPPATPKKQKKQQRPRYDEDVVYDGDSGEDYDGGSFYTTLTKTQALEQYPQLEWYHLESIRYTTKRNPHSSKYPMKLFEVQDLEELAGRVDAGGWTGKTPKKKKSAKKLAYEDLDRAEFDDEDGPCDEAGPMVAPAPVVAAPPPPTDPSEVVARSYARDSYKLTNADLACLHFEVKQSPRGGAMNLFNRCEVEAVAVRKYGKAYFDTQLKPQADRMRAARARGKR